MCVSSVDPGGEVLALCAINTANEYEDISTGPEKILPSLAYYHVAVCI